MQTKTLFVVYRTIKVEDQTIDESVIDFSEDREVADKIQSLKENDGISCRVVKELAATDGSNDMYIVKSADTLDINKAKKLQDFKDHVIRNMSPFDKRVLLASKSLTI